MTAISSAPLAPAAWLKQTGRTWRRPAMLAAVLTIADVLPAIGFAAGLALGVDRFAQSPAAAAPWLALAAISLIARGLLGQAAVAVGARLGRVVKQDVRGRLLADMFGQGRRSGERLTALVEGVEALDGYYGRFAPLRLAAGLSPLLIVAAAAVASPVSAGVLLFTLLPFVLGMILAGTAAASESRRQFQALERLSGLFIDRVRALPAVLAFGATDRITAQIATASDELERRTARVLRIAFASSAVLEFFSALSVALIAVYCGFNLLRLLPFPVPETLDLGRAFFVLALAPEVYQPLRRLAAAYHDRQAAEAAAPALVTPDRPAPMRLKLGETAPSIRFQAVSVAYDGAAPVIADFDLDVRPGQMVALVGASGAGKSSLLHLLLGLSPLTAGAVEIGGVRLGDGVDLSGQIAWASQAPVVVPGSLAHNVAVADPAACPGRVKAAAQTAGLTGDLERLIDERGGGLSGGERRRLGLARAMLKRAPVLLLDEPTANLDPASEQAVLAVIREAARGRTTLIATHSTAVAALADRVVRL
ncbi:thiol reductant ABC exporter subunit CydD [Brevundimonas sp. SORGH_AS_0993]|uniref:thiol reductant ABC exporter subunit CydD n=1 Tax=Brevundimonas sp. SORGH_AS_0993 TaxID=3041794 RepID=UPI0027892EA0|nr:thiol reductant ABC exporter subunit CydD [Brevundimonas sp. SORGH_AS_0993]MDQ1152825.1 ATP-binding cassette subfamily C protein CydD [Brevundimonas sp. SORGH_AS_0993]